MSERQEGWYHVKDESGFWQCAQWNGYAWHGVFVENGLDDYWQEIGPRIPTPDEPWQTVPVEATPDMLDIQTLGYHTLASKRWRETLAVAPKP